SCLLLVRAEVDRLLEARQVLIGKIQIRLGQQDVYKLLGHVISQTALVVLHLRTGDGGGILRGIDAGLTFVPTLEGVGEAQVEFRDVVQGGGIKLAGAENGNVQIIIGEHRVGANGRRSLLRLALLNRVFRRLQRVIVFDRELNGL